MWRKLIIIFIKSHKVKICDWLGHLWMRRCCQQWPRATEIFWKTLGRTQQGRACLTHPWGQPTIRMGKSGHDIHPRAAKAMNFFTKGYQESLCGVVKVICFLSLDTSQWDPQLFMHYHLLVIVRVAPSPTKSHLPNILTVLPRMQCSQSQQMRWWWWRISRCSGRNWFEFPDIQNWIFPDFQFFRIFHISLCPISSFVNWATTQWRKLKIENPKPSQIFRPCSMAKQKIWPPSANSWNSFQQCKSFLLRSLYEKTLGGHCPNRDVGVCPAQTSSPENSEPVFFNEYYPS